MTEIPDEIMEEARAVRIETDRQCGCDFPSICPEAVGGCSVVIANALLAAERRGEERERGRRAEEARHWALPWRVTP